MRLTVCVITVLSAILLPLYSVAQIDIPAKALGQIEDYKNEIEQYQKADKLAGSTTAMNKIAQLYWQYSHYDEAIDYYEQSLKINYQIQNYNAVAHIHNNLAMLFNETGNYNEALKHLKENYVYVKSAGDPDRIIQSLLNIATAQRRLKQYNEAAQTLEDALEIARTNSLREDMAHCFGELSNLYTAMGNKEKAERYYNDYYAIQQTLYRNSQQNAEFERLRRENAERLKQIKELELKQTEKELSEIKDTVKYISSRHKQLADSLDANQLALELIKQENRNKALENEQLLREKQVQRRFMIFAFVAMLIVIGFAIQVWYSSRKIKRINTTLTFKNTEINQKNEEILTQAESLRKAKEQIEQKHSQITASIEYARLIQRAVLNPRYSLTDYIADSFIWYQPRDVVSGDFYWYAKMNDKLVIAAGDCTGHGVPGGFLTMTGHNLLGQIVQHRGIIDPAEILTELEKEFSHALHQDFSENMDGMDISIVVLDSKSRKLHYSGAKSPLLIIENDNLSVLDPDFYSIGGISLMQFSKQPKKEFKTQTLDMPANFSFYMHSDGPVDQFNIRDKERLMKHRFYNMLKATDNLSAKEQKEEVRRKIHDWQGKTKQTDDILLICGKIKNYTIG